MKTDPKLYIRRHCFVLSVHIPFDEMVECWTVSDERSFFKTYFLAAFVSCDKNYWLKFNYTHRYFN